MKRNIIFMLLASSIFYYSCQTNKTEIIEPQAASNIDLEGKNLRGPFVQPDLIIYAFSKYGGVSQDSTNYIIPFLCSEKNIGTANATGAYSDTLKVYQKVAIGSGISTYYKYFLVDKFVRPSNIAVGSVYFFVASIKFPKYRRPFSGKINLVITADGGNRIAELNETNNMSATIWDIMLP